jgi:anti-sigma B factor antagonist
MDFKMSEPQQHGPILLLELSGRLDGRAAQALQQRCSEIRNQGFQRLALDLSRITFLASSGLGVFLAETEEFAEAGGGLSLVDPSTVVSAVMKLLNVDRFLSIVSSIEELKSSISS